MSAPVDPGAPVYGSLGPIAPHQFQAALNRFNLGALIDAAPARDGLFGQNVFVTSTQGKYVLRGRPLGPWQFPKERFGAELLHKNGIPVPYPYLLDESIDIFGWSYVIMPRLEGLGANSGQYSVGEQIWVARALGSNLARMHEVTWPFAGEYDMASDTIRPFGEGYAAWFANDTRAWMKRNSDQGFLTSDDVSWAEQIVVSAAPALAVDFKPCFVMQDYNPGNVFVACIDGEWRVTGVIDFTEYFIGDGEADLVRFVAAGLEMERHKDSRLARGFAESYFASRKPRPLFAERFAVAMLRDRLMVWEHIRKVANAAKLHGVTFHMYAERYLNSYRAFEGCLK